MNFKNLCLVGLLLSCSAAILSFAEVKFPNRLQHHVEDLAHVISRPMENNLNRLLQQVKQQTAAEIAVVTVPSLQGESIEQLTIRMTDQWQLGAKESDLGVLLLLAVNDRQLRIEVGQGLEGNLTDAYSRRIIDESMVPLLKTGDYDSAVLVGVYQILKRALPELNVDALFQQDHIKVPAKHRSLKGWEVILQIIIFLLIILFGRGGLFGFLLGAGLGRGYRSGGFSGGFGGGSLGGGGGFSGGGASGSW